MLGDKSVRDFFIGCYQVAVDAAIADAVLDGLRRFLCGEQEARAPRGTVLR